MKDLSELFEDFFNDLKITNDRMVTYAEDQETRLTDNNPANVYDDIIADTNTKAVALKDILVSRTSDTNTRIGSTTSKDEAKKDLIDYISRKEGLVKSTFGKGSAQYKEFFPQGLTGIRKATEEQFDTMTRVITEKAEKYETQLGSTFKSEVTALFNTWHTAYTTQNEDSVSADNAGTEEAEEATTLRLQLTKNALFIAYNNVGDPEAFDTYFDMNKLFAQKRTHIYKGEAPAGSTTQVHELEYSAGKNLHMKNKGAVALSFQMWLNGSPVGDAFTVQPGEVVKKSYSDFFGVGDSLHVTNDSATVEGLYEVRDIA